MKKEVLKLLKNNQDKYFSGVKISEKLNVSRTAIWKVINKLKDEGYQIESVSSKGYRLIEKKDILNEEELAIMIDEYDFLHKSFYAKEIDSTNDFIKLEADKYKDLNMVSVSEKQLKGKGRLGRTWESNNGLYMSYLLRPNILPIEAPLFTQIGAAAVVLTFKELSNMDVKIKWPNDIVVDGKKICGILTELNAELNKVNYLVLGIGINLNQDSFNEELKEIATSYKIETGEILKPKRFLSVFLEKFDKLLKAFLEEKNISNTLDICREYSAIIGKEVNVIHNENIRKVKVKDINDKGQLIVINDSGKEEVIFYGEISIRGINKKYI